MKSITNPAHGTAAELTGLLEIHNEPAILLNPDYRILAANRAYRRAYGDEQVESRCCYEVSHRYQVPCDQAGESCPLKESLTSGMPQRTLHLHHTPRGEEHVDVEMFPIRDDAGEITFFVEIMRQTRSVSALPSEEGLVGRAESFTRMLQLMHRAAPSDAAVLLLGETGTGKELVARAIHEESRRSQGPFVPVECSGLTETLFESELFGHEKGAFTGAHARRVGLVEAARGGTLFLDEVGDIPLAMQIKLLRLLETGTYRRIGSVEPQNADFRLVCATHRQLAYMVRDGTFRQDLFYRINTFPLHLPSLRERIVDLPLLIESLLKRVGNDRNLSLNPDALHCLERYRFPGNIRELRNILERASLLTEGEVIMPTHLPDECQCHDAAGAGVGTWSEEVLPLAEVERRYLRQVAARFKGDKRSLAARLGLSERTLYRKLQAAKQDWAERE